MTTHRAAAQSLFCGEAPELAITTVHVPAKAGPRWHIVKEDHVWFVVRGNERKGPFPTYEAAEMECDRLIFPERVK